MTSVMRGAETVVVDTWLASVLSSDTDLTAALGGPGKVFDGVAPDAQPYPFVVWHLETTRDIYGVGPRARIMVENDYRIRGIAGVTSFTVLAPIAVALDALLDGAEATLPEGLVLSSRRLEQYRLTEDINGQQIRQLGGLYRFLAVGAPITGS